MRIGVGYDIHRLDEGRKLILGGVEIPYIKGLMGYSDADVLIHAICDALLGAAALGDIGEHFPDTAPSFKDVSSVKLLEAVEELLKKENFYIVNIDSVLMAEEPKLKPYKAKIKNSVAGILKLKEDRVNIKAKTCEGCDAVGKGEAISAFAVVMIEKTENRIT
jgi:2-C-methyl-D-erythritol 2,4-cyclodiphosphate synthase